MSSTEELMKQLEDRVKPARKRENTELIAKARKILRDTEGKSDMATIELLKAFRQKLISEMKREQLLTKLGFSGVAAIASNAILPGLGIWVAAAAAAYSNKPVNDYVEGCYKPIIAVFTYRLKQIRE